MGEWKYNSILLDLGIRWRLVVSFTPSGKEHPVPIA
jgi:hypothetical protein